MTPRTSGSGGRRSPRLSRIDDGLRDQLVESLRQGQAAESRRLIIEGYAAGRSAVRLGDDLIRPVMERIGHGWQTGQLDVFQEHEATQIILSTLVELIARATKSQPTGPHLALGASAEGDYYSLPGMLAELLLREQGWDVRNLGCNLPLRSLTLATEEYAPRLVFLAVNFIADIDQFIQEYSLFYKVASRMDVAVMLGGRALGSDLRSKLVFASFGDRMAHLGEFARRLVPTSVSAAGLSQASDISIDGSGQSATDLEIR